MKKMFFKNVAMLVSVLIIFTSLSVSFTIVSSAEEGVAGLGVPTSLESNSWGYFIKTADACAPKYGTSHNRTLGKAIAYYGIYEKNEDGSIGSFKETLDEEYNDTTVAGFSLFSALPGTHPWGANDKAEATGSQYSAASVNKSENGFKYKTLEISWDWSSFPEVMDILCMVQYNVGNGRYYLVLNYMAYIDYNDSSVIAEFTGDDLGATPSQKTINDFEPNRKPLYSFARQALETDNAIKAIAASDDKGAAVAAARAKYDALDAEAKALVTELETLLHEENNLDPKNKAVINIDGVLDGAYEKGKCFDVKTAYGYLVSSSETVDNNQNVTGKIYTAIDKAFMYFYIDVFDDNLVFNQSGSYNSNPAGDLIYYDGIAFYIDPDPSNNPAQMPGEDSIDESCKNMQIFVDASGYIYQQTDKYGILNEPGYSKTFIKGNENNGYTGYGIELKLPRVENEENYLFNLLIVSPAYDDNNEIIGSEVLAVSLGAAWGHTYANYAELYYEDMTVLLNVNDVIEMIDALPAAQEITDDSLKRDISSIREALDSFSDDQKGSIPEDKITHFEDCEKALKKILDKAKEKAAQTDSLIENIGVVTVDSEAAISAARNSYDSLTSLEKGYVEKYSVLTAAEREFIKLTTRIYGDINGDGKVTSADALLALQAAVNKITLTDDKIAVADVDTIKGVTAADALSILQYSVGKINIFPIEKNK